MAKKDNGSKWKAPFDGPQTRTIKNPDKPEVVDWDKQDLKETLKVLSPVTNIDQHRKLLPLKRPSTGIASHGMRR